MITSLNPHLRPEVILARKEAMREVFIPSALISAVSSPPSFNTLNLYDLVTSDIPSSPIRRTCTSSLAKILVEPAGRYFSSFHLLHSKKSAKFPGWAFCSADYTQETRKCGFDSQRNNLKRFSVHLAQVHVEPEWMWDIDLNAVEAKVAHGGGQTALNVLF